MCEPVSGTAGIVTAVISAFTALASTAVTIYSNVQQNNTQKAVNNYQTKVSENNAKIAEQNAASERQSGLEEARLQRLKTLQSIGQQQSAFAANNIDVSQGTALDVIESTGQMGELDALMTQYNSERAAQNYEQQANNFTNKANMDIIAAQNVSNASKWNAAAQGLGDLASNYDNLSDGLGSLGKVSSKWKNYKGKFSGGLKTDSFSLNANG